MKSLKSLIKYRNQLIKENVDSSELDVINNMIKNKRKSRGMLFENTSATGGASGAASGGSVYSGGTGMVDATTTGMGGVVSPQPSAFPGALNGVDWMSGGGKSGSGDISVPYNPSGKNRIFQKIKKGGHGSMTPKKSRVKGIDIKSFVNKGDSGVKKSKIMKWDDFQKDDINKVTKVKEGRTYDAAKKKDKSDSYDKRGTFNDKIRNIVKSLGHDFKVVGNDLEIHKDGDMVAQVMFRKDYVGVKKVGTKFTDEFGYDELGKIKSKITSILK